MSDLLFPELSSAPWGEQWGGSLAQLASEGVFVGTSSWKYSGWRGQLYDESLYRFRGRFSETRFEQHCLEEYGRWFSTVCVDAAYYTFPSERFLSGLASQVRSDFQFSFKVTDQITLCRFPNLRRFGARGGQGNPDFLNADLFSSAFLKPLESIRPQVGLVIFEFAKFHVADFGDCGEFITVLERFLKQLPSGWRYGVELRNRTFLQTEYFDCLHRNGVAHVFNSWDAMPSVGEQLAIPQAFTASFSGARFLLKPGRKYEEAVEKFRPYSKIVETNAEARQAALALILQSLREKRGTYIYINNRLEGNALGTIAAVVAAVMGARKSFERDAGKMRTEGDRTEK